MNETTCWKSLESFRCGFIQWWRFWRTWTVSGVPFGLQKCRVWWFEPTWRSSFPYVFISILYMSNCINTSGLSLCRWSIGMLSSAHHQEIQLYQYICCMSLYVGEQLVCSFSWWWALECSKHVEIICRNIEINNTEKNCVKLFIYMN